MRIYYASMDSANTSKIPESKIWYYNLFCTLNKKHEVIRPDFNVQDQHLKTVKTDDYRQKEKNKIFYSEKLLTHLETEDKKKKIDIFFSYFYNDSILPEVIQKIRNLGIITINFYCNSIHQFDNVSAIAPLYDYSMFPEKEAYDKYKKARANPVHIQMAANPDFYKPYNLKQKFDAVFIGQSYLNRKDFIEYLYLNGINVHVFGPNWNKRVFAPENILKNNDPVTKIKRKFGLYKSKIPEKNIGKSLSDNDLIKMYSRSRISLNFSEQLITDNDQNKGTIKRYLKLRDFEAPMCRAFYMTGLQEELKEYYEIDKEIICYDTKEELLDKIKYYLAHQDEAEKIKIAGYNRALKDHTWDNRFRELFFKIGLKYD